MHRPNKIVFIISKSQLDPRKPFPSPRGQVSEGWVASHCSMPTARAIRIFRGIMT